MLAALGVLAGCTAMALDRNLDAQGRRLTQMDSYLASQEDQLAKLRDQQQELQEQFKRQQMSAAELQHALDEVRRVNASAEEGNEEQRRRKAALDGKYQDLQKQLRTPR